MSKSRARAWALFGVVTVLSACGGGGDGGGSSNAGNPPPPSSQSGLLSATVGYVNGATMLTVLDADQPSATRTTTLVDDHLIVGGLVIDANARTDTYTGDSIVYYVRAGQLFQMSLRKGSNNTAQRISSTTAACTVRDWHPLRFDGSDDAWIEITEAGFDRNCTQASDNRVGYVRTGASTNTAPIFLPTGVSMVESLPDPVSRTLAGFVAIDSRGGSSKLIYYGSNLALLGDVAGGAGLGNLNFLSFRPGPSLDSSAFVLTALELRRLTWSASGASLSAPLHAYMDFPESDAFLDVNAMYFVDGRRVMRADAAGAVNLLGELSAATAGRVELKGLTSGHVIFEAHGGANLSAIYSLSKSGGTPLPIAASSEISHAVGVNGDDVIYTVEPLFEGPMSVRRIHASGANNRVITSAAARWPSFVYRPAFTYYAGFAIDAVVWCEPLAPATDCRNGNVRSFDLGTGVTTTLGGIPASNSPGRLRFSGYSYAGQPMLANYFDADASSNAAATDVYLMRPGTANSLVRLTSYIP